MDVRSIRPIEKKKKAEARPSANAPKCATPPSPSSPRRAKSPLGCLRLELELPWELRRLRKYRVHADNRSCNHDPRDELGEERADVGNKIYMPDEARACRGVYDRIDQLVD